MNLSIDVIFKLNNKDHEMSSTTMNINVCHYGNYNFDLILTKLCMRITYDME